MKNFKLIILIVTVIFAGFLTYLFVETTRGSFNVGVILVLFIYIPFLNVIFLRNCEITSFNNPSTISRNNVRKMFKIREINGNKIGLVTWGYKNKISSSVGGISNHITYYYNKNIPQEFRNISQIFKVELIQDGLVFKKVQINGYEDPSKKPFEVLNQVYSV